MTSGRMARSTPSAGFGTAFAPALLIRLALVRPGWGLVYAALFTNAMVTALTAVLLAALVRRLGYRPATALWLGGVYGLATLALPYARHVVRRTGVCACAVGRGRPPRTERR